MLVVTRARAMFGLGVGLLLLASCGSHENNHLGVALIDDQGEFKAIRLLERDAPTDAANYRLAEPPVAATLGTVLVGSRPGFLSRGLVRFPQESFPAAGTVVDSAFVEFIVRDGFGMTSPLEILLHRVSVTADWTEDLSDPASFPMFEAQALDTLRIPIVPGVVDTFRVEFQSIAQAWTDDSTSNRGLALIPAGGADAEVELFSRETGGTRLLIHTTPEGEVVTTDSPASADTFLLESLTPPADPPTGRMILARGLPTRILLKFDWPDPGDRATIHRAELVVHVDTAASLTNGFEVGVARVLESPPWSGEATEAEVILQGVTTATADADSVVLAITPIVDVLLQEENQGFQLRALPSQEGVDTDVLTLHGADTAVPGKEPHLRIWYTPGSGGEDAP